MSLATSENFMLFSVKEYSRSRSRMDHKSGSAPSMREYLRVASYERIRTEEKAGKIGSEAEGSNLNVPYRHLLAETKEDVT
jgi:hypothetical protein